MQSDITLRIVEPGSSTPVVPNTGLFTSGIGGPEATIIGIAAVVILAALIAVLYYRKKKQGKVGSLLAIYKQTLKHKKATTIGLTSLALIVSIGTVAGLLKLGANAANTDEQANEQTSGQVNEETNETATVEDGEITIELGDTPVFAYIPTTVTVTEGMPAGYTLKAYSENPTLSSEGTDKTIDLVTIPEDGLENAGSLTTSLTDNTWGLAVEEPESEAQDIYFSLPATADEAVTIATVDDTAAEDSNTTTVYYGIYITPGLPYGTYTGASVNYEVEPISTSATVVFDGNGLYFNDNTSQTTNTAKYTIETTDNSEKYSYTPNVGSDGNKISNLNYNTFVNSIVTIPGAAKLNIELTYGGGLWYGSQFGYLSFWPGSHPDYRANINYETGVQNCGESAVTDGRFGTDSTETTVQCEITGDTVTFDYWTSDGGPGGKEWYGYYAVVTGYDADGNIIYLKENNLASGSYLIPDSATSHRFLGWNTDSEATTATYPNEESIARDLSLTIGETTTLYAIWEPAFVISYNGNGADSTTNMDSVEQYTTDIESESKSVDLLASNFARDGYGFVGWSEDEDAWDKLVDNDDSNNPTIYGPNQTITVDPSTSTKLALYAVWAPAEEENGTPVTLQNWQGCSNLTATTYDAQTGTLNVGKNTITALTDSRDGNVYTVARLADGNCWTTENLRLDNEPELSASNTNNPSLPLTNNYAEETTSNYLSATSNSWCTDYNSAPCFNQSKLNTNNTALTSTSPVFSQDFTNEVHNWRTGSLDANIASYGNYYNWYSATVGNGKQETTSITAGDICPTGWSLPIGSQTEANGSFSYLDTTMGGTGSYEGTTEASNRWRSFPNNFVYSGYWYGSSADVRGSYGSYWSSTAYYTGNAYGLNFVSDNVYPGTNSNYKYYGYSARCVAPVE